MLLLLLRSRKIGARIEWGMVGMKAEGGMACRSVLFKQSMPERGRED